MKKRCFGAVFITVALTALLPVAPAMPQVETVPEAAPEAAGADQSDQAGSTEAQTTAAPGDSTYFADVMARGQAVFQVGSLSDLSASERAAIVSRRIASLLERTDGPIAVTSAPAANKNLVNIEANNRVLMTVTEQDAQDLGIPLEALAEDWANRLQQSFEKPSVAIDVVQRLNGTLRQLLRNAVGSIPALIGVLIVILATWLVAKGVRYSAFRWAEQTEGDHSTEVLIGRLGYGGIWVVGAVIALGVWGIDFATMLGALGLTSVAIGFSLKDVLSNYISGVILLSARPFKIGDQVVIEGYEGTITQVQLRSTTLTTYDGRMVYIPNQEVFQASITNNTAANYLRSSVTVGIDYDADIVRARQVILKAVSTLNNVQPNPMPEVLVRELAASTVNLEIRFWVDSRRASFLETTSMVTQRIKEALQSENIEMPTEIYTLLLKDVPAGLKQGHVQENDQGHGGAIAATQGPTPSQEGTLKEV